MYPRTLVATDGSPLSKKAVTHAIDLAAGSGAELIAFKVVPRSDLVAESIIAAARKHEAELIIMASHGRKGIKRLLLGSETQHVLRHSSLPVPVLR